MSTLHNDGLCMSAWLLCVHPDNVSHPAIALDYLQEHGMDRGYALAELRCCAADWCKEAYPERLETTVYRNTPFGVVTALRYGTFNPDTSIETSDTSFNEMCSDIMDGMNNDREVWLPFCVRVEQAYAVLCELEKYA